MREDKNETRWDKLLHIRTMGRDDSHSDQHRFPMNRHHIVCWNVWQMPVTSAKEIR